MSQKNSVNSNITTDTNHIGFIIPQTGKFKINVANDTWIPDNAKNNYHTQRLKQSKWAFWLSFWGAIVGFIILIITTFICIFTDNHSAIGYISSIIIEGISALFFALSNKANEKISEFFDKLTLDSNTSHAMQMAKEISNNDARDQLLIKLSLHLAGIKEDKICQQTIDICSGKLQNIHNSAPQ